MDLKKMHPKYPLTPEQEGQVLESVDYVKKLHVEEFMHELLTHLAYHQPENPRAFLIELLNNSAKDDKGYLRVNQDHLEKVEYEAMFDSYDVLGSKTIPYAYLVQALESVGVPNAREILKSNYPDLKESAPIGKKMFVTVLSAEHKSHGYSTA